MTEIKGAHYNLSKSFAIFCNSELVQKVVDVRPVYIQYVQQCVVFAKQISPNLAKTHFRFRISQEPVKQKYLTCQQNKSIH